MLAVQEADLLLYSVWKRAGLGWAGMGWDGMGWDGMGWDGMGWAGMGWAGLGWAGLGSMNGVLPLMMGGILREIESSLGS